MKLHRIEPAQYPQIRALIAPDSCGAVYPLSAAEGIQSGVIYADDSRRAALIHHFCGFAFLCGKTGDVILRDIADRLQNPESYARMILFAPDEQTAVYFSKQDGFAVERRLFFRYSEETAPPEAPPAAAITAEMLPQIHGRITPAFSWDSPEAFLQSGMGFCVMQDNIPAAWAFSAAVSAREIDIGVETNEAYRRRGFAFAAAAAMIHAVRAQGKTPVWACHAGNTASQRLAESLGFAQCGECMTIRSERR